MSGTLIKILKSFLKEKTIFKYGFNLSPMYRRSTGRVISITEDLLVVKVKIPISYKNKNFVGSVFGGSLFSATDPIFMIQLMQVLGNVYVVWDKNVSIKFKKPLKEDGYANFVFTTDEIVQIKKEVIEKKQIDLHKDLIITNKEGTIVFAEVSKTIYIANKEFYKNKRKKK